MRLSKTCWCLVVIGVAGCSTNKPVTKPVFRKSLVVNAVPLTPQVLDQDIIHRADGTCVVPWSPMFGPNQVWLWTNQDFITTKQLDNSLPYTCPVGLFVNDRYIVSDTSGGAGPVSVNEYDANTFQYLISFQ